MGEPLYDEREENVRTKSPVLEANWRSNFSFLFISMNTFDVLL